MDISVAICTWNRAQLLRATLEQMCSLRIPPGVSWELLVVNNNSTDATDSVIASYEGRLPIRRLLERRQGVSRAGNCALAAARGNLLVWTADDVLVDPEWLASYHTASLSWPDAAFFGGAVFPWYESPPPAWIENSKGASWAVLGLRRYDDTVRPFAQGEEPIGNNMAVRLNVHRRFLFNEALGYVGGQLGAGEDLDLVERLMRAGLRGIWVGTARIRHWVPRSRMRYKYLWDWCFAAGAQEARTGRVAGRRVLGSPVGFIARRSLRGIRSYVSGCLFRDDARRVSGFRDLAFQSGMIWAGARQLNQRVRFGILTRSVSEDLAKAPG